MYMYSRNLWVPSLHVCDLAAWRAILGATNVRSCARASASEFRLLGRPSTLSLVCPLGNTHTHIPMHG